MPDRRKEFGALVRGARERAGYKKPEELAAAADISKRSVDSVELGQHTGQKVLRAVARTLGWREADVLGYIAEELDKLPEPTPLALPPAIDLAPLDEILNADLDLLKTFARMWAHFEARRASRAVNTADQERFMLWALQIRAEHAKRDIEPRDGSERDVS